MQRTINTHKVNLVNDQIEITVNDPPGSGGASHSYTLTGFNTATNISYNEHEEKISSDIIFQNGPIAEVGVNGITLEALLVVGIDRLECFQAGPYKSDYNQKALDHIKAALDALLQRTKERMARGVEGTHKV